MPKEPQERYMEWLSRKEEELGVGRLMGFLADWEACEAELSEEAGRRVEFHEVEAFMTWGKARYEVMPEVGVTSYRFERPWGFQMVYRDILTGRFMSYTATSERIRGYWREWGY